jgi:hypothetical protein
MEAGSRKVPTVGDTAMLRALPASPLLSVCALTLKLEISRPNSSSDFHATAMLNCDMVEVVRVVQAVNV